MTRGDIYLVHRPNRHDPKRQRAFAVVSRRILIDSRRATVICVPIYTSRAGISTQVLVGIGEGLKHESAIHCDELVGLPRSSLTDFVGSLSTEKLQELEGALRIALAIRARNRRPLKAITFNGEEKLIKAV